MKLIKWFFTDNACPVSVAIIYFTISLFMKCKFIKGLAVFAIGILLTSLAMVLLGI